MTMYICQACDCKCVFSEEELVSNDILDIGEGEVQDILCPHAMEITQIEVMEEIE